MGAGETSQLESNPYASPAYASDAKQADWHLASACRYFKSIGWVAIVYVMCAMLTWLYELLMDESPQLGQTIGMPTMMTAVGVFYGALVRTAMRLPADFQRLYRRARWLGILAGAFGFPFLTIPAFIGVSRLSKHRSMIDSDADGSLG